MLSTVPPYTPPFLQHFWLTYSGSGPIHSYDLYSTELTELPLTAKVTHELILGGVDPSRLGSSANHLHTMVCDRFRVLEQQTEAILDRIISQFPFSPTSISLSRNMLDILLKYFSFLRFRNSLNYSRIVEDITTSPKQSDLEGEYGYDSQYPTWRAFFITIYAFLCSNRKYLDDPHYARTWFTDQIKTFCWDVLRTGEISIGITKDDQEYILPDKCFGILQEESEPNQPDSFFFPISPSMSLYIISTGEESWPSSNLVSISIDHETELDVHLRNAMILSTMSIDPRSSDSGQKLYFGSLFSITRSISSYEEFRFRDSPGFIDYSHLKRRCRQRYLQSTVTKMLIVKGNITVSDLTDEVVLGPHPVAFGAFSDVWKGQWYDHMERKERVVAIKFLRQVMVQKVKEKLMKRLQTEVAVWHGLCHRNVSQLYGIVQSETSVGMVSAWCEKGTVAQYLKEVKGVDRMRLLRQIASGVAYLHAFRPTIIHGDLKGGNIFVDGHGEAIISDFGLSKVMSELPDIVCSSFFAGSTRWMAPELVEALASDELIPRVTTASDVYAFASVCLEVLTDLQPFPNRKTDTSVMLDIIRKVKPYWGCPEDWTSHHPKPFLDLLDRCWRDQPSERPTMASVFEELQAFKS